LGGGFPEVFAKRISENKTVLDHIRSLSRAGLPIYAECGGFMILCETLEHEKQTYPMAGVFPIGTTFCQKPQGLGYTKGEVLAETPFFQKGTVVLGHEFHYSACKSHSGKVPHCTLKMLRGKGGWNGRDGVLYKNTIAGYNHIHALAVPQWAKSFVAAAGKKVS
jgi:cobyrinic acid a,c-diamide synthase